MTTSAVYSCGTCRVKFPTLEMMHTHYKCDWHRYNLKRKVAELPPVSAENFQEILKAYQNDPTKKGPAGTVGGINSADDTQADSLYCKVCAKSFLNSGSFTSHLDSKKHIEKSKDSVDSVEDSVVSVDSRSSKKVAAPEASKQVADDAMEEGEDDWEDEDDEVDLPPYDVTLCLYCDKKSESLERNLLHMSNFHTFFLPDFDYCSDPAGLIDYLGKKVGHGHMCLYCNQRFQNTIAVQRHMKAKGHMKMFYESESFLEYEEFYDFTNLNEKNEATPTDHVADLDGTGYEMTLPSGATIGHRDLSRFYKQSLRPVKDVALVSRVVSHYKALGWKPNEQGMGYAKNTLKELNRVKKDSMKKRLHVGMQTNKIMMEHYRRAYGF